MSGNAIATDIVAILLAIAGFYLAFRQQSVRRRWRLWRGDRAPKRMPEEDPAPYAMIIFGSMLMAFGILLFGFTTVFHLSS